MILKEPTILLVTVVPKKEWLRQRGTCHKWCILKIFYELCLCVNLMPTLRHDTTHLFCLTIFKSACTCVSHPTNSPSISPFSLYSSVDMVPYKLISTISACWAPVHLKASFSSFAFCRSYFPDLNDFCFPWILWLMSWTVVEQGVQVPLTCKSSFYFTCLRWFHGISYPMLTNVYAKSWDLEHWQKSFNILGLN